MSEFTNRCDFICLLPHLTTMWNSVNSSLSLLSPIANHEASGIDSEDAILSGFPVCTPTLSLAVDTKEGYVKCFWELWEKYMVMWRFWNSCVVFFITCISMNFWNDFHRECVCVYVLYNFWGLMWDRLVEGDWMRTGFIWRLFYPLPIAFVLWLSQDLSRSGTVVWNLQSKHWPVLVAWHSNAKWAKTGKNG